MFKLIIAIIELILIFTAAYGISFVFLKGAASGPVCPPQASRDNRDKKKSGLFGKLFSAGAESEITGNGLDDVIIRILLGLGVLAYLTFLAAALRLTGIVFFIAVLAAGNLLFVKNRGALVSKFAFGDQGAFLKCAVCRSHASGNPLDPQKTFVKLEGDAQRPLPGKSMQKNRFFGLLLAVFFVVNFFFSLFPPTFYDSLLYHLAVPNYYIMNGGITPWLTNFFSNLPLNGEMLFFFALLGKTPYIPKLLSLSAGLGIILLLFSWYRRQFSRGFSALPLLLFYTIPQVGFLTSSSKTDIPGMLFLFAGVRLFFYYIEKKNRGLLLLSGFFWGFAIGSKYIFAFFLLGFFFSLLFYKPLKFKKKAVAIVTISIVVLLCLLPWFVKNAVITGNPLYPYMNNIFKSKHWDSGQSANFSTTIKRGSGHSLWKYLYYPIEIFITPYSYGMTAVLGILFLAFAPFLFFLRKSPEARCLAFSGIISFAVLLPFSMVPRYFLASFLLLSIPMAVGAEQAMKKSKSIKKIILLFLTVLLLFNLVLQVDMQEKYFNGFAYLKGKLGGKFKESKIKYLYTVPYYRAAEYINSHLSETDRVIFLGEDRSFYVKKEFIVSSFFDRNPLLDFLRKSRDFADFSLLLKEAGITHILYYPAGLERMAGKSPIYRLDASLKAKLGDFLANFLPIFRDKRYVLYRIIAQR
ncbi:MAG: glycosyltransferase family 39 protein [Candidatus Aminicenantes bacterium]|nr:glycosyltransferase family 39 protein [Candidatus Aminicenantes bacterium]